MKKIKLRGKLKHIMLDDGKQESDLFIFNPALRSRVVATVRRYTIELNNLKEKRK